MRVGGGTSPIKKTLLYKERDENLRREFQERIKCIAKDRLVFLDKSGIDTFVSRHFGRAQRGEKIQGEISGKRYARKSFIAAKVGSKIIAPMIFEGTCNSELFETWVEKVLVQELIPGQLIIMDNATFHKSAKTKKLIEQAECQLLFLPPYSPDLNSIENFWAYLKKRIREIIDNFMTLEQAIIFAFKTVPFLI
ncbi:MAG: IS630 family transposase [Chthoniobacterales bacterium]|nr:IS630 family transposase [Chthoniobacterales bacterium]